MTTTEMLSETEDQLATSGNPPAPQIVYYHGPGCWDGFCAAWVIRQHWPEAVFIPCQHGDAPPSSESVEGCDIIIVDFSWDRETLLRLNTSANSLLVLDNHKSAQLELQGLSFCRFDMNKSGGRLAWEWFNHQKKSPWLVDYTEDRDLWKWELPNTHAVNAGLRSHPLDFHLWDQFAERTTLGIQQDGYAILRYQEGIIRAAVKHAGRAVISGFNVPIINTTTLVSEIVGQLAEGEPFAAGWFQKADGTRVFSLRSDKNGADVSAIARRFGGGGHQHAAGFTMPKVSRDLSNAAGLDTVPADSPIWG